MCVHSDSLACNCTKFPTQDVATEFRGRSEIINVFPLSFVEFAATKLSNAINTIGKISCNETTVRKYLGYLESAFLVHNAKLFDLRDNRYLDYPSKFYAVDTEHSAVSSRSQIDRNILNVTLRTIHPNSCL